MNNNNIKLNSPKLSSPTTSAKGRDEEGAPFTTTGPPLGFMQDHVFVFCIFAVICYVSLKNP